MPLVGDGAVILAAYVGGAVKPPGRLRLFVIVAGVALILQAENLVKGDRLVAGGIRPLIKAVPAAGYLPPDTAIGGHAQQDFLRREAAVNQRAHGLRAGQAAVLMGIKPRMMAGDAVKT